MRRAGRSARNVPVNATVVPEGSGKHLVSFECREPVQELELSLVVDENTDETCDRVWPDERVTLEAVDINVPSDQSASPGGSPQAVVAPGGNAATLSGLAPGVRYLCTVLSSVTGKLTEGTGLPAFRLELARPDAKEQGTTT